MRIRQLLASATASATATTAFAAVTLCVGLAPPAGATPTADGPDPAVAASGDPFFGDVDGDGHPDQITLVHDTPQCWIVVRAGAGPGADRPEVARPYLPPGEPDSDMGCPDVGIVVDLGGDGTPEIVLGWTTAQVGFDYHLFVLRNFVPAGTVGNGIRNASGRLELTDLNGDGLLDIVSVSGWGLYTYRNTAAGTLVLGPHQICTVDIRYAMSDFDHDGGTDIVVGTLDDCGDPDTPSLLLVLFGNGRVLTLNGSTNFPNVDIVDANRDGRPDVRTTSPHTGPNTYLNRGDGTFALGPQANDDVAHAYRATPKVIKVRDNDWASTAATLTIVTPPRYGYLDTGDPRYEVRYVRTATHRLADTFAYRLTDDGKQDTATVTVKMKD